MYVSLAFFKVCREYYLEHQESQLKTNSATLGHRNNISSDFFSPVVLFFVSTEDRTWDLMLGRCKGATPIAQILF